MKRLGSDDSLGALMSICPNSTDEHNQGNNPMYAREFQNMLEGLDEEGCVDEGGHVSEKKRRLNVDQVKALEKNFEVENKLEPERKVKLAQELGLQPRQVAVWFQNRRARWKTKQLERDYGVLKANYDDLKLKFESLQRDNESLLKEINELKSKMDVDVKTESNKLYVKEEGMVSDSEEKGNLESENLPKSDEAAAAATDDDHHQLDFEIFNGNNTTTTTNGEASTFGDFKDGLSDSDSSAILNEDNNSSPNDQPFLENNFHSGSAACTISFQLSDFSKPSGGGAIGGEDDPTKGGGGYQPSPQYVKIEEHNFFGEECCSTNFFSDDQAPTLHWYCSDDQWN